MKVSGGAATGATGPSRAIRNVQGEGFAPPAPSAETSVGGTRIANAGSVGGLSMLLALQEAPGPLERRRRAVRRGASLLDALDEVRLTLLDGRSPVGTLDRLREAVSQAREQTDEASLDELLGLIDVRAAVELAKREPRAVLRRIADGRSAAVALAPAR